MFIFKLAVPLALALGISTAHAEIKFVTLAQDLGPSVSYEDFNAPGDRTERYIQLGYASIHYPSGVTLRANDAAQFFANGLQYAPGAIYPAATYAGSTVLVDFSELGGVSSVGANFGSVEGPSCCTVSQRVRLTFVDGAEEWLNLAELFGYARGLDEFVGFISTDKLIRSAMFAQLGLNPQFDNLSWTTAAVPEPGTLALLALGLASIALRRR